MFHIVRSLALLGTTAVALALGACQPNHPNTRIAGVTGAVR